MSRLLEVCVDSLESAAVAAQAGAHRLELCANLVIGGTTPSPAFLRAVRRETGPPVRCLLRPRAGDFLYTPAQFDLLLEEGESLLAAGAEGLVTGFLTPEGDLDLPRLARVRDLCRRYGARLTLHRAFDLCRDPFAALAQCRELGVDTVLTSGQADRCLDGLELLEALFPLAGPVELLLGGGIDGPAIRQIRARIPAAAAFHMSGKVAVDSPMRYRRPGVSMGLPGLSEYTLYRADPLRLAQAKEALV